MASKGSTIRAVQALKPGETLWDAGHNEAVRGFGIRRQRGDAVYVIKYRVFGRQRFVTIGRHGSPWTPDKARREAKRLLGLVVQLKDALNTVWEVKDPPISGVWSFIRTYALSLAGILAVRFLLLVSMLMTAALAAVGQRLGPYLPEVSLQLVGFFLSFGIISLLFAMMFKWLPDTPVAWSYVWLGAIVT